MNEWIICIPSLCLCLLFLLKHGTSEARNQAGNRGLNAALWSLEIFAVFFRDGRGLSHAHMHVHTHTSWNLQAPALAGRWRLRPCDLRAVTDSGPAELTVLRWTWSSATADLCQPPD